MFSYCLLISLKYQNQCHLLHFCQFYFDSVKSFFGAYTKTQNYFSVFYFTFYHHYIIFINAMQALNSWSSVTLTNHEQKCQQTKKYGHYRLILGQYCAQILNQLQINWWLDGGSLLGAYRDGKMIAHDDDFDIGVIATQDQFYQLYQKIQEKINPHFRLKFVETYCQKIQVYDSHYGSYKLNTLHNVTFHNVTVNIQRYNLEQDNNVKIIYLKDDFSDFFPLAYDMIFPLGKIKYCGHRFNCPHKLQEYLQAYYGYLGLGASYDKVTRKYRQNQLIPKNISNKADQGNHEELKNQ